MRCRLSPEMRPINLRRLRLKAERKAHWEGLNRVIYMQRSSIIVWDLESVLDLAGFAAANVV
jgi:hypothetical protein